MEQDELQLENLQKSRDNSFLAKLRKFNFDELLFKYRWPLTFLLIGVILVGFGVFFAKDNNYANSPKVEVLESATEAQGITSEIVVEVSGAVESPGVYKFVTGARIEDVLIAAEGVSADADREWMEKFLNRAAKITDGQKIFIPRAGESAENGTGLRPIGTSGPEGGVVGISTININAASQKELESLWGIGPVYAQNIIEHRPYSSVDELLTRKIIKTNVYERNKDKLSVY
ncbi:helix-hairpin-helix domain-containing protein [Patescibacteria group bacterium]|nr:helix-hairpin-helix domain-containing protein [Patescibacteria group bacterium]